MESLLPLLLFIVFFALRALANKQQPPPKRVPGEQTPEASDGTGDEMDEALRQIREALGMPAPVQNAPSPAPQTAQPTPQPVPPVVRPAPPSRPQPPRKSAPRRTAPVFAEDAFEQLRDTFVPPHDAPHLGKRVAPLPQKPAETPPDVADTLLTPAAARQAFLYGEIFGAPRAKKPLRR